MTYSSEVLADAPAGYWRQGEASGTTMNDSSGNAHGGTYTSVTLAATGALYGDADTAATYNGTSSHADVAYAAWMALTTAYSVEAWIKTTATGERSILDRDQNSSRVCQFTINGGNLKFTKISGSVVIASQATSINDGAWHHVVATYDGSNIRLYKDGALINTTAAAGTLAGTDAISIGADRSAGYNAFFNGQIDEVAYYTSVLTLSRINAHYTAGIAPVIAATIVVPRPGLATAIAQAPSWNEIIPVASDTTNAGDGRSRGGIGVVEVTYPVDPVPPGLTLGERVDKTIAYPTPDMVDGRPT